MNLDAEFRSVVHALSILAGCVDIAWPREDVGRLSRAAESGCAGRGFFGNRSRAAGFPGHHRICVMVGKGGSAATVHDTQAVELQGAKSVNADIEMPAGKLVLSGRVQPLARCRFQLSNCGGKTPRRLCGDWEKGQLDVTQNEKHIHFGGRRNDWTLRFGNTIPLDLKLELGAGQSDLNLNGMNVTRLEINIGVGQMNLDLTGDRKEDLQVDVQGGVGSARIKLPKNVGVHVNASGGIGSVNAHGMRREGDAYVNEMYGKTHATIQVNVQGGVGEISLVEE